MHFRRMHEEEIWRNIEIEFMEYKQTVYKISGIT